MNDMNELPPIGFASGTRLAFQQSDAPKGWTKDEKASEAEPQGFIVAVKD